MIFRYIDYRDRNPVFEVEADSILTADELLKAATGIEAVKAFHIGCYLSSKEPA